MSESYPSWLPKRPPPPAPASTFESSQPPRPRAEDVFYGQGRKATPRSVRIVARDPPWREPTGDSAETRVPSRPQRDSRGSLLPPQTSHPRFKAPSLHLSLLRSPSITMRIQYMLHFVSTFGHLFVQSYFDFNVVFMLLLVVIRPGPTNSPRNWTLATVVYIACWVFQVFGVFLLYEVIYSFGRRWRVKRPLILPLYLSAPAHKLVGISSYTNFCFFAYIRRSARPPWSSLFTLPSPVTVQSPSPSSSRSSDSSSSTDDFSDYIAEWCFWRSQNLPTVILLLPRAGLSLSLLFNFSRRSGVTGRDSTFFDVNGALSGYASGVLLANAAWTAWRVLVLLGSVLGLWVLSGTACAGLCGPRYRWEEERAQHFDLQEKRASFTTSELGYPYTSDDDGQSMSDGWTWKQGTRERVREAWELCLTIVRPVREYPTSNVRARNKEHEDEFAGLDEVLAAAGFASPRFPPQAQAQAQAHRSVLSSEFFAPAQGREALSDIIPPAHEAPGATDAYGSQRSRRSDPLRVLPYPFKEFPTMKSGESSAVDKGKGKEKEVAETGSIPFPSPVPSPEEDAPDDGDEGDEEGEEEEAEGAVGEEDFDEEEIIEGRRTSESMSSLGQPVNTGYPFAIRRTARSFASASRSTGTPSHRRPHSTSASPSQSTPSTRGSRVTPSTRGSRVSRSTPSNKESGDSPRSPRSAVSGEEQSIPPPPPNPRRRRRAGTVPTTPPSHLPIPGPSHTGPRMRTRTISASNSSSRSRGLEPEPEALYESDESAGRVPSPEADGSQEEAEKEDSVGLLSAAPSPKASLAGIRQRASNLSHRRGNGSRSTSSASPPGSVGQASRSGSARSRAQSLIHSLSRRASLGEFGTPQARSRSSSAVRNESVYSDSPQSAMTGSGSGSQRVSQSGSGSANGSASGTGSGSGNGSGEGAPGIEHTFGRPGELTSHRERLELLEAPDAGPSDSISLHGTGAEASSDLPHASSEISGVAPSEATERLHVPPSEGDQSRTDISTANQSFVTAPLTVESTTEGGSGQSVPTFTHGLRHHVPGGTWGHEPA